MCGRWTSSYKLDNSGNGELKSFKDPAYQIVESVSAVSDAERMFLVGKGSNRFGDFIISGTFDQKSAVMELR